MKKINTFFRCARYFLYAFFIDFKMYKQYEDYLMENCKELNIEKSLNRFQYARYQTKALKRMIEYNNRYLDVDDI